MEDPVIPPDPDAPLEALLATVPWPEGGADLDDETLAAWAEGGLSDVERDAVEARLAEWPEGRAWMAEVRAALEADAPEATTAPSVVSSRPRAAA